MALVAAISQPSFCVDWTRTAGQSRFCTTAVGASINIPEGEYSIRTSDGVRNSKRAFPAGMVGLLCVFAQHTRNAGTSPMNSHLAALARPRGGPRYVYACASRLATVRTPARS